jgi:hypothetical protein
MIEPIVIQNIVSTAEWRTIFEYALSYGNQFAVTFPAGEYDVENPLLGGKKKLERLSGLLVTASTEMENGVFLSGELNKDSSALFNEYMTPSYNGFKPVLWNFQLLKDDEPILEVSDFTVCILYNTAPMKQFLQSANIDIDLLKNE